MASRLPPPISPQRLYGSLDNKCLLAVTGCLLAATGCLFAATECLLAVTECLLAVTENRPETY